MSLNAPISDVDGALEYQDTLVTDQPSPEAVVADFENREFRRELFVNALEGLKDRERHIFTERKLKDEPATLEELGQFYGLSRERIRQIEAKAMSHVDRMCDKLRRKMMRFGLPFFQPKHNNIALV